MIIRFRGKYKTKDNEGWVYGVPIEKYMIYGMEYNEFYYIEVLPETVGQFTGQTDKNNVEIYKDDILRDEKGRRFVVTWNNDIGSWVNKPINKELSYPCFNVGTVKGLEKLGNIHDNPELVND